MENNNSTRVRGAISRIAITIGFILLLVPLFRAQSLSHFVSWPINEVYYAGTMAAALIAVFLYLRFVHCEACGILVIILSCTILFSTLANGDSFKSWYVSMWPGVIAITLLAVVGCREARVEFVAALFTVTFALSCINAVSMILFPGGLFSPTPMYGPQSDYFFFGHRNSVFKLVLPSAACGFLLAELTHKRALSLLGVTSLLLGFTQVFLQFSATSCVAFAIMSLCMIALQLKPPRIVLNLFSFIGIYASFFIGIVILRLQYFLAFFIEGVLHKDLTFTNRTLIWDKVFSIMDIDHLLCGYGIRASKHLQITESFRAPSAHNDLLNMWLTGGLIAAASYAALILLTAYRLFRNAAYYACAIIAVTLGCFLVVGLTETIGSVAMFAFVALGCNWCHEADKTQH